MNKILVIKHVGPNLISLKTFEIVAKLIKDVWNETGIIAIPDQFDYEFIDCDKFMGVTIDKDIANERFENGCLPESSSIRVSRDMSEILKGNYIELDDGRIIPGVRSVTFSKPEFTTSTT